jgi:IS5 family transposase
LQVKPGSIHKNPAAQRGRRNKGGAAWARKAARRLKTIAGRVGRQLDAAVPKESRDRHWEETAKKILSQKRSESGKIYSLHEPEVYYISKGKEHKKYEFGAKGKQE